MATMAPTPSAARGTSRTGSSLEPFSSNPPRRPEHDELLNRFLAETRHKQKARSAEPVLQSEGDFQKEPTDIIYETSDENLNNTTVAQAAPEARRQVEERAPGFSKSSPDDYLGSVVAEAQQLDRSSLSSELTSQSRLANTDNTDGTSASSKLTILPIFARPDSSQPLEVSQEPSKIQEAGNNAISESDANLSSGDSDRLMRLLRLHSTMTSQQSDMAMKRRRLTKTMSCLRDLCKSIRLVVDTSRLDDLEKDLSFNVDHAESSMRALRSRTSKVLLEQLQQTVGSSEVAIELPKIRKLCLARMMELAVRCQTLPERMRVDGDVRPVSKSVRYVAKGGFGYVYKTRLRSDKTLVAVKVPKEEIQEKSKALFREILLWSHLRHDNILAFEGVCVFQNKFPSIVSPWMERGTVTQFCRDEGVHVSMKFTLLGHVATALDYLHNQDPQIIHEDVRGANILVNSLGSAVLSDFGISRINSELFAEMSSRLQHGNIRWAAPELLFPKEGRAPPKPRSESELSETENKFTKASAHSDIWSFAMTAVEVLTGKIPFSDAVGRYDAAVMVHIYDRKLPRRHAVERMAGVALPDYFWDAVEECWDKEPDKRPSASAMLIQLKKAQLDSPQDTQVFGESRPRVEVF